MEKILVTRSSMPSYEEYCEEIKELWDTHWLTNMGPKHKQLQKELEAASKQRDETAKELENLKFNAAVGEIAKKYGFSDSDYLGYRLRSADIAIDDESGVSGFIKSLEQTSPQLFTSSARSGGGTASGHQTSTIDAAKARLVELGGKAQLSSRELAEVVELTEKVGSQAQ